MSPSGLRWGILGVGIAGRARAKALRALGEDLIGVHRGRFAAETGATAFEDGDALLEAADAVIVASPSHTHVQWVRRALGAACHVVVEFPLARTAEEARDLFAQARAAGKVLHVEHIERLSGSTRVLIEALDGATGVVSSMSFSSGGEPWPDADTHLWHNISRLHRIEAVLGRIMAVDVLRADGARVEAAITAAAGTVALHLERGTAERRHLSWRLTHGDHQWEVDGRTLRRDGQAVEMPATRLFEEDLRIARRRILEGGASYVDDADVVRILELSARMARQVHGAVSPSGSPHPT